MKLISIDSTLLAESIRVSKRWVSPDTVSGEHSYAFVFNPDGRLDISADTIHAEIIGNNIHYYVRTHGIDPPPDIIEYEDLEDFQNDYYNYLYNVRNVIEATALIGRVGYVGKNNDKQIVSLWNDKMPIINALLPKCLKALGSKGVIHDNPLVSVANAGTFKNVRKQKRAEAVHNLQGARKVAAQKALGLLPDNGEELPMDAPMTAAMKKHGFLNPGQKWWAMHSESENKGTSNDI